MKIYTTTHSQHGTMSASGAAFHSSPLSLVFLSPVSLGPLGQGRSHLAEVVQRIVDLAQLAKGLVGHPVVVVATAQPRVYLFGERGHKEGSSPRHSVSHSTTLGRVHNPRREPHRGRLLALAKLLDGLISQLDKLLDNLRKGVLDLRRE